MYPSRDVALPAPSARFGALALLLLLITLLLPRPVSASRPVIPPGREDEILALFDPYGLGDEITPGWTLHSFSIDVATINVWLVGPDQAYVHLTLDHPDYGPPYKQRLDGFTLAVVEQPPGSEAAIAEITATIERNDDGEFWRLHAVDADEARTHPFEGFGHRLSLSRMLDWAGDGLVLLAMFTLVLLVLVIHNLRGAEGWMKWALLGIVIVGVLVRLMLSPKVALEAWPYTRFLISGRLIFRGPGLAALHPDPVWATETITTSTLALGMLAPPAVYVHARYLLDDQRAALIAAGILACLPMHIRFSHTDVAFIPSITVSAMLFTLTYVATREPSRWLGWLAVLVIGFPLAFVYQVRPLNIMYYALLIVVPWVNHGVYTEKLAPHWPRFAITFVIMTLVTVFGGIPWLFESFEDQVREGLSWRTLISAIEVLLSLRMNALINPVFMPPGLTALAVVGAVDLWRRGKRRLFWFLVLWLFAFLIAHAYVVPRSPYMQARYHLHLIVPFLLLGACGVETALRWLAANRERRSWLAGRRYYAVIASLFVYLGLSPLIHIHFVRNTELNDAREWLFVHSLRDRIPAECTIIEYTGTGADARMNRVGAYVENGVPRSRWQVHEIRAVAPGEPEIPAEVRALLEDPPECLFWYEGLPCLGQKPIEADKAPACDAIEGFVVLEEVAGTSFESQTYDENLAVGLGELDRITLTLYRAYPRPPD
ncbi:MAG TPA: hypothetical protein VK034_19735 [Enhygromyxa sp.]|nr:hypothetical protein [Enhygromyxa sp.]